MPFVPHGIAPVPRFARSSQLPKQNPADVGRADEVENYECLLLIDLARRGAQEQFDPYRQAWCCEGGPRSKFFRKYQ